MTTERVKSIKTKAQRTQFVDEIEAAVAESERQVIMEEGLTADQLDGSFLFGVENHIVTNLRKSLMNKQNQADAIKKKLTKERLENQQLRSEKEELLKKNKELEEQLKKLKEKTQK